MQLFPGILQWQCTDICWAHYRQNTSACRLTPAGTAVVRLRRPRTATLSPLLHQHCALHSAVSCGVAADAHQWQVLCWLVLQSISQPVIELSDVDQVHLKRMVVLHELLPVYAARNSCDGQGRLEDFVLLQQRARPAARNVRRQTADGDACR